MRKHILKSSAVCWFNPCECFKMIEYIIFNFIYVHEYHCQDEISDVMVIIGSWKKNICYLSII